MDPASAVMDFLSFLGAGDIALYNKTPGIVLYPETYPYLVSAWLANSDSDDEELPGMWEEADLIGGATDAEEG